MLWTALVLGFAGSLHCAGMCGPLALAVGGAGNFGAGPVAGALAYNLGRLVTYALLGVVFGVAGKSLALFGIQGWVSIAIGVLMLVGLLTTSRFLRAVPLIHVVGRLKSVLTRAIQRPSFGSLSLLGLLNGLLPCGLVYTAGGAAIATGSWAVGIQYMAVFGVGTLPMMLGLAIFGKSVPFALRLRLQSLTPVVVAAMAVLLIIRGLELGIPYLSPSVSHGCVQCH